MNNSKKRTFSQFHSADRQYLDLCDSTPEPTPKKQKLTDFHEPNSPSNTNQSPNRSPSIEIISVIIPNNDHKPSIKPPTFISKLIVTDNKENNGDINNSKSNSNSTSISVPQISTTSINNSNPSDDNTDNSIEWINNSNCHIIEHRIENEWYEFKIISLVNPNQFQWCKHNELEHLSIYNKYLQSHDLDAEDVSQPQYTPEQILDHQWDEDLDEIRFNVKWKGYPNEHNSWEPHANLQDNELYIKYCRQHGIKPMLSESANENDESESEYEEEEIDSDINESKDITINSDINDVNETKDIEIIDISDEIIVNDEIDIEKEYNLAVKENKIFNVEYIIEIIGVIDRKMEQMFEVPIDLTNNSNTNNKNNALDLQTEIDKLLDIRQYFENLKGELLFKRLIQQNDIHIQGEVLPIYESNNQISMNDNNNVMDVDDNNNNTNNNIEQSHDNDIMQIIEGTKSKVNVETPMIEKETKRRKTLFDYYSFTPTKSKNINKKTPLRTRNNNKINNKTNTNKKRKKPKVSAQWSDILAVNDNIITISDSDNDNSMEQKDEIPMEYLQQNSTCYLCKRKWPLFACEFFKAFPMCNTCPKHIRLGHNRKFREDWFCPYCIHSAQCVLFPSYNNAISNYNGIPLDNICNNNINLYLYIKPNNSNYWKTYILLNVNNISTGNIIVREKRNSNPIEIQLSNIENKYILWAWKDKKHSKSMDHKSVSSVVSFKNENVVIKLGKKKPAITVHRSEIIICDKYLSKLLTQKIKQCKQKGIKVNRAKIFEHSRRIKEANRLKKQKKNQFGADTIVRESAPVNSRYFNTNNNSNNIPEIIPNYQETTKGLLNIFNLESISESKNLVTPPQRELLLKDLQKYNLILIVGPSGSGKSTLLKSIQSQAPDEITFLDPNNLEWENNKCVISQFSDVSVKKAMEYMSSIGLNNVRTWLKPPYIASTGEKYRCGMALSFKQNVNKNKHFILIDEFGSVLDPTTSRCMAAATGKCIRKNNLSFILASGNIDIVRYLQPDLLILLGGNNSMELIENPNDLNNNWFDVKAILDLPPFVKTRKDDINYNANDFKSISKLTVFDDLIPKNKPIEINKEVRELKCKVIMDHHAKEISNVLDVEDFNGECVTHIPCLQEKHLYSNWNIGIIVGPSGCGKTTSGERLFGRPKDIKWDCQRNIATHFKDINSFKELCMAVDLPLNIGFSYFNLLSEGEQHRANIMRYLNGQVNNEYVLIDEFTSYLDRITAKRVAKGVSDYIYKYNMKNCVFLCCKYDIISGRNGIYPSWIFDVANKKITHYKFNKRVNLTENNNNKMKLYPSHKLIDITNAWNTPKIRLVLKRCTRYDFAPTFSRYHYMDASITTSAKCFSVWAYFSYSKHKKNKNKNKNRNKKSDKEEASDSDEKEEEEEDIIFDDDGYYNENELELVGFTSFLNHYGRNICTMADDSVTHINYREHRTVILPSFQGLGFGSRIADCMGEYLALHGQRLHSKTAHPRYGGYRNESLLWKATKRNGIKQKRTKWKKDVDRMVWGGHLEACGPAKKYFIHVYRLHNERSAKGDRLLEKRVIVKNNYQQLSQ